MICEPPAAAKTLSSQPNNLTVKHPPGDITAAGKMLSNHLRFRARGQYFIPTSSFTCAKMPGRHQEQLAIESNPVSPLNSCRNRLTAQNATRPVPPRGHASTTSSASASAVTNGCCLTSLDEDLRAWDPIPLDRIKLCAQSTCPCRLRIHLDQCLLSCQPDRHRALEDLVVFTCRTLTLCRPFAVEGVIDCGSWSFLLASVSLSTDGIPSAIWASILGAGGCKATELHPGCALDLR